MSEKKIEIDFSIEDIITNADDLTPFQCQICFNSVIDFKKGSKSLSYDVLQCKNGHISCHNCWERQLELKKECPSCKVKTTLNELSRNIFLENIFRGLKVNCPNLFKEARFEDDLVKCDAGCKEVLKVEALEHHLKECKFEFIRCPNSVKCKSIIRKNQLKNHNESTCEFYEIPCEKCSQSISKFKMESHLLNGECKSYIVNCEFCIKPIGLSVLKYHLDNDCERYEIPCLYAQGGCNKLIARADLPQHLSENNNHITFIQNIIGLQKLQLEECNNDYKKLEKVQKDMEKRLVQLENNLHNIEYNPSRQHPYQDKFQIPSSPTTTTTTISNGKYSGKWSINNWERKMREFPISKSFNSPQFQIGHMKFFLMIYPNGNNDVKGWVSIFLYKIFDSPTTVKYSLEAKNADPTKNYKNSHINKYINNNGNGWFKWIENKPTNGFFSNDTLTIEIKIKIIQEGNLVTN